MSKHGWTYKKLGEVAEVFAGQGAPQGDSNYSIDGTPFVKAGNLSDLINGVSEFSIQKVSEHVAQSHKLKLYKAGSVLFAKSGMSCMKGLVYTLKNDCYVVSHLAIITPHSVDSHFLNYYLCYNKPNSLIKDAAYPSISLKDIENLKILIPPIDEQKRIVSELDLLSRVIEKKKEQLKAYGQLAQSIFYTMFGDPISNKKGWKVKTLSDVCGITSPLVDPQQYPYSEMLHVSPSNIISGTGEMTKCPLTNEEFLISNKYTFTKEMVLYSKIRPNLNKVATPNFDGICSADMYPLTIKSNASKIYVKHLLLGKSFLEYAIKHSGRARMPKINREALFAYSFPLPPLSLQQEFAEKVEAIEHQKALIQQSIDETQTMFDYTMDKYFG